jgi:hypothetical protein
MLGSYFAQARSARRKSTSGHWPSAMRRYHFHALCCTDWYMNYFAVVVIGVVGNYLLEMAS